MTPIAVRLITVLLLAGIGLTVSATAQAAGPAVSTAPGRIVLAVDNGAVRPNVDAGGAGFAISQPDGSTLLLGGGSARGVLHGAKVGLRGELDRAFGTGGVASLAVPGAALLNLLQVLRQPDGKLLLVGGRRQSASSFASAMLQVTRLNADLTLDNSFGAGGSALTGVGEGCGACTIAALQPDGAIVLTGVTGSVPAPPAPPNRRWAVTRLTASGAIDTGFGAGGIATIPTAISSSGFNVAIAPGGRIVASAQSQGSPIGGETRILLTRLTPGGAQDPSFAGGVPVTVPFSSGFLMVVQDDGSVVLNGQLASSPTPTAMPARTLLARYTATGAPDAGFGTGGFVDLGNALGLQQMLPRPGRSLLLVATPNFAPAPGSFPRPGRLLLRGIGAGGAQSADRTVNLPFGGGGSSVLVSVRPRPLPTLLQNSFTAATLTLRADGSYLVVGGVAVTQPTGEGTGFSIGRFAAAALTPALTLDPAFGGPAATPRLSVLLSRQRASTARRRHGIRIQVTSSAVGLARVKIAHGGRTIAQSLLPVFRTTRHTLPVALTRYGNAYLRRHRNLRVTITATVRDLLTTPRTTRVRGRLR